jgi:hypothetical protein
VFDDVVARGRYFGLGGCLIVFQMMDALYAVEV